MRSRCILPVLLLPLAACEPMEDPGSPFAPVPVAGQAAPATVDPGLAPEAFEVAAVPAPLAASP